MCSFNMEITFVLSTAIIKKVVKCSLLVTPKLVHLLLSLSSIMSRNTLART
jgi:hypothetical protein